MISLSFDTDHMNEERMEDFLSDVAPPDGSTFFCTQRYRCFEKTKFELAPHPFLGGGRDWLMELKAKRAEFPKARGWRSHSCVFSHTLAEWVSCNGYAYVSTHDSFGMVGIQPTRHLWGVWHAPIYYMDNLDFSRNRFAPERKEQPFSRRLIESALNDDGLYVFDFHPIHLVLNTPNPDWYMEARGRFLAGEKVATLRYDGYGARSFFEDLRSEAGANNKHSVSILKALETSTASLLKPSDVNALPYNFDEKRLGL